MSGPGYTQAFSLQTQEELCPSTSSLPGRQAHRRARPRGLCRVVELERCRPSSAGRGPSGVGDRQPVAQPRVRCRVPPQRDRPHRRARRRGRPLVRGLGCERGHGGSRQRARAGVRRQLPLEPGESTSELAGKFPAGELGTALVPVPLPAAADSGEDLYIEQSKFRAVFAADVPEEAAALMAATQRPSPPRPSRTRPAGPAGRRSRRGRW